MKVRDFGVSFFSQYFSAICKMNFKDNTKILSRIQAFSFIRQFLRNLLPLSLNLMKLIFSPRVVITRFDYIFGIQHLFKFGTFCKMIRSKENPGFVSGAGTARETKMCQWSFKLALEHGRQSQNFFTFGKICQRDLKDRKLCGTGDRKNPSFFLCKNKYSFYTHITNISQSFFSTLSQVQS